MSELLTAIVGKDKALSSLRGPNPPALVCGGCQRVIQPTWENPLLALAKKKGWYSGAITGGTAACEACDNVYTQQRIAERQAQRLEKSGLPLVMQAWTLNTYPGPKHYLKLAHAWLEADRRSDVVLFGPPGTTKTGLAVAMLRHLLERSLSVLFLRGADMVLQIRDTYRVNSDGKQDKSELNTLSKWCEVNTLVLDDLTALRKSEFFEDTLLYLLDTRQKQNRCTIITANLTKDERETFFGPVLFDRLREAAAWWHLDGASVRRPSR
jgi:DNA replication protein DnaC